MNLLVLVLAILCFAVATLLGFGVFSGEHILGWLALGLAFFAASFLVPETWRRGPPAA